MFETPQGWIRVGEMLYRYREGRTFRIYGTQDRLYLQSYAFEKGWIDVTSEMDGLNSDLKDAWDNTRPDIGSTTFQQALDTLVLITNIMTGDIPS